ncbi:MAG: hypothetical protein E7508_00640 [Ruminococcus sp.]|nr:hypothetical protein [Ruminococcus sp.]
MKKGLILGLVAGAAAAAAAVLFIKKKQDEYCYYDEDMDDLDCDCCSDCCDCGDECSCDEIPADKAEESMIMTDACVACGASEEEALAAIEDEVESDEV